VATALSLATVTGLAAAVGVVIAREFGRSAETDGFFAAYAVFVVLVLAATAARIAVLPPLTRARVEGRLAGETAAYALALAVIAVPALAVALFAPGWLASLLTVDPVAQQAAEDALVWMLPAALAQLYAGLLASALAATDDYITAALGYAAGSLLGFALIVARVDADGIVAVAWGIALNGAIALAVPLVRLTMRASGRPLATGAGVLDRFAALARAVALPLAVQALYVVCLRFAADEGVGAATSFTYAYLISAALVAVTASSLGLVSSAPLTRTGLDAAAAARHVLATAWLSLAVIAGAIGAFAVAGGRLLDLALGSAYAGDTGEELGRLVVAFAPWCVASVGFSVTFPLLFVAERTRLLVPIAVGALLLHVPLAWAAGRAFGLTGLALALAVTTTAILAALLAALSPETLLAVARGLGVPAALGAGLALAAFGLASVPLGGLAAAAVGLVLYAALLALGRPRGLREAVRYVRVLR
jgi:putative peptidoglycan lipid II flippase